MKRKHIKIIIVLAVLLLAVAVGLAIPALLHPGEDTEAVPVALQPGGEPGSTDAENESATSELGGTNATSSDASDPMPGTGDTSAPTDQPGDTPASAGEGVDGNPGPADPLAEADLTNQSWVEAKIAENLDRIADEDLDDFRTIIGKLDMDHINAILEGRIDPDIEDSLRTYLRSRLNGAEYERAKELFVTYEHLLFG